MDSSIRHVLVASSTTADDRKTLAAVRGLAGAGVHVTLASNNDRCLPRRSRYCHEFMTYREPETDPDALSRFFVAQLDARPQDAILPLCDYTTQALVKQQDILSAHTGVCVPNPGQMARAADKERLLALAEDLGIGVPRTFCIDSEAALDDAAASISYPCVLKLRRGAGGVGRSFPDSAPALRHAFAALHGTVDGVFDHTRPLLQEFIPGDVHDVCVLFNRGEPRAALTQRRLAMFPAEGGVGVYNETTDDPDLREQAITLMRALRWHGPAQVEFKRDARDGSLRLMEVNPRFWGTLDLAIRAGINFPYLTASIAARGDVKPVTRYEKGVRLRWVFSYGSPDRPATNFQPMAVIDALLQRKHRYSDLWLSDPLPHLGALRH